MSVAGKVQESLERGQIPAEFIEEQRLLPENNATAKKFAATMELVHERVMKGLLGDGYVKSEHEVRFVLSADKEANAFVATSAKPPVIGFTTGMINMCENESELAAVLIHELGHDYFRKKLGAHVNGKLEELGADLRGPYMLRKAGYPQDAMRKMIEKLPDERGAMAWLATALDEHPTKANRTSTLQTAERALVRGKFGMGEQQAADIADSKISAELQREAGAAKFTSFVDGLLERQGYDRAPVTQKMAILDNVLNNELQHVDPYFTTRIKDFTSRIKALSLSPNNAEHNAGMTKLVDSIILNANGSAKDFYKAAQTVVTGQKADAWMLAPIGNLKTLDDTIKRFTAATSPQEIRAAANEMNRMVEKYPFSQYGNVVKTIKFSGFKVPEEAELSAATVERPITPSWNAHVKAAVQTRDPEVVRALSHLGITHDKRLEGLPGDGFNFPKVNSGFNDNVYIDSQRHRVIVNEQGQITGVKNLNHDLLYAEELAASKASMALRDGHERQLVQSTNWTDLEKDFYKFTQDHAKALAADIGIADGGHVFAERFVQESQKLIAKNPEKFRPLVGAFFSRAQERNLPALETAATHPDMPQTLARILSDGRPTGGYIKTPELTIEPRGMGISAQHPFTQFLMNDPEGLFTPAEKMNDLGRIRYFDMNPEHKAVPAQDRWLVDNTKFYEATHAADYSGMEGRLAEIRKLYPADRPDSMRGVLPLGETTADLIQIEALKALAATERTLTLPELRTARELATFNKDVDETVGAALREQIGKKTATFAKEVQPAANLEAVLGEFKTLAGERLGVGYLAPVFTEHPQLRVKYQDAVKTAVDGIADPAQKMKALEALLFKDELHSAHTALLADTYTSASEGGKAKPFKYDGSLADPEFKSWATKNYATTLAESLGKDDGSAVYNARFKAAIERVAAEAPAGNSIPILNRLGSKACANKLLYGHENGEVLKATMEKIGLNQAVKYHFQAAVGESALELLGKNYETRQASIDFVTKPFNEEAAKKFIDRMENGLSNDDREKFMAKTLSSEAKIEQVSLLHKNFWGLPFEGRVIAAKQILYPASESGKAEQLVKKGTQDVLDRVMPVKGLVATGEVKDGRNVTESYLAATTNLEDKRLITSAMLVANEPNGATVGEKLSVGKGLNLVLGAIDPAGDKVKQAIESHTDTPANIKAEFRDSKTMAKDPARHEVQAWLDESNKALPPEKQVKLGKVLGAGSYGITVEGIYGDGSTVARTLLYPHVREKAVNEFGILNDATGHLIQKDSKFSPLKDMVRQAQRMSHVETDMEIAAEQGKIAGHLYNGAKVTVDGKEVTFSSAKYISHGQNHKDFEIIHGDHFNDLAHAAETAEQKAHVQLLAKAQVALELSHILGGKPFDHDVHGGQQKIVGNNVGRFDNGAMSITAMSAREKQMIGHVVGGTIKQHYVKGVPMGAALSKEMKRVATNEYERDFLATVERGLLATGDFRSHMKEEELGTIIASLFSSGKVDADIKKAMQERLGSISDRAFSELEKRGAASGIKVESGEHSFTPSADMSPLKAPPKESLLERIPLKDEHIIGGASATAGFGGFAMMMHANHRIDQKKEAGETVTGTDRAEQIGGGALAATGTVLAVDQLAFKGRGTKSLGKFTSRLTRGEALEIAQDALLKEDGKMGFGGAVVVALGAAALGTSIYALKKHNQAKAETQMAWVDKTQNPPEQQQAATR